MPIDEECLECVEALPIKLCGQGLDSSNENATLEKDSTSAELDSSLKHC